MRNKTLSLIFRIILTKWACMGFKQRCFHLRWVTVQTKGRIQRLNSSNALSVTSTQNVNMQQQQMSFVLKVKRDRWCFWSVITAELRWNTSRPDERCLLFDVCSVTHPRHGSEWKSPAPLPETIRHKPSSLRHLLVWRQCHLVLLHQAHESMVL